MVFIQHTSASLTLNENASPDVRRDFASWFDRAVPDGADYFTHTLEGDDDMPAHIKSSLTRRVTGAPGARRPAGARHLAGHLPLRAPRQRRAAAARLDGVRRGALASVLRRMRTCVRALGQPEGRERGARAAARLPRPAGDPHVRRTRGARRALPRGPGASRRSTGCRRQSRMPFRWTINPYRGCTHACVFCFARPTHTYLDLNAGRDFEREIVVKVNVPEVLRAELARPSLEARARRARDQHRSRTSGSRAATS